MQAKVKEKLANISVSVMLEGLPEKESALEKPRLPPGSSPFSGHHDGGHVTSCGAHSTRGGNGKRKGHRLDSVFSGDNL